MAASTWAIQLENLKSTTSRTKSGEIGASDDNLGSKRVRTGHFGPIVSALLAEHKVSNACESRSNIPLPLSIMYLVDSSAW